MLLDPPQPGVKFADEHTVPDDRGVVFHYRLAQPSDLRTKSSYLTGQPINPAPLFVDAPALLVNASALVIDAAPLVILANDQLLQHRDDMAEIGAVALAHRMTP